MCVCVRGGVAENHGTLHKPSYKTYTPFTVLCSTTSILVMILHSNVYTHHVCKLIESQRERPISIVVLSDEAIVLCPDQSSRALLTGIHIELTVC